MTTHANGAGERFWDGPPAPAPAQPCVGCGRPTIPGVAALTATGPGRFAATVQAQCLRCRAEQKVATLEARLNGTLDPPVLPEARELVETALDYWRQTLAQEQTAPAA